MKLAFSLSSCLVLRLLLAEPSLPARNSALKLGKVALSQEKGG